MEKSNLIPYVRKDLDILFVGLNPAKGSSQNKHYFSVKQSFWEQLYYSGLITTSVDKSNADDKIFGSNRYNYNNWNYGITDLITEVAESDSRKVNPSIDDCIRLEREILFYKPRTVVLLHGKVIKYFFRYLALSKPLANTGKLGKIISDSNTVFFNIAFPHGNAITNELKIKRYIELKDHLLTNK